MKIKTLKKIIKKKKGKEEILLNYRTHTTRLVWSYPFLSAGLVLQA